MTIAKDRISAPGQAGNEGKHTPNVFQKTARATKSIRFTGVILPPKSPHNLQILPQSRADKLRDHKSRRFPQKIK